MKRNESYLAIHRALHGAALRSAHPPPAAERDLLGSNGERAEDSAAPNDAVALHSSVAIRDLQTGEVDVYTLAPPESADILCNRISSFTPLGKALFGRRAGDVVEVAAPAGAIRCRIESVRLAPESEEAPAAEP